MPLVTVRTLFAVAALVAALAPLRPRPPEEITRGEFPDGPRPGRARSSRPDR